MLHIIAVLGSIYSVNSAVGEGESITNPDSSTAASGVSSCLDQCRQDSSCESIGELCKSKSPSLSVHHLCVPSPNLNLRVRLSLSSWVHTPSLAPLLSIILSLIDNWRPNQMASTSISNFPLFLFSSFPLFLFSSFPLFLFSSFPHCTNTIAISMNVKVGSKTISQHPSYLGYSDGSCETSDGRRSDLTAGDYSQTGREYLEKQENFSMLFV